MIRPEPLVVAVALVDLVAAHAAVILAVLAQDDFARRLEREIGHSAAPHLMRAAVGQEVAIDARRPRDVHILPQIDAHALTGHIAHELGGIGKARAIPLERAGIRAGLPARLKPQHVDFQPVALERGYFAARGPLVGADVQAVPEAEAPLRGQTAAAQQPVERRHGVAHGVAAGDVDVRARANERNLDKLGALVARPVVVAAAVQFGRRVERVGAHRAAHVEGHDLGGIDEHAVARVGDIERHGRVRAAGVAPGVVVASQVPRGVIHAHFLKAQAQPVEPFAGGERYAQHEAIAHPLRFDPRGGQRTGVARKARRIDRRAGKGEQTAQGVGRSQAQLPDVVHA